MCIRSNSSIKNSYWPGVFVFAFVGFILRLWIAFASEHFYHPDELYQLLEQAHRLVYGNGLIPWEFRFGTRSWIPPGLIAIILYILKCIHIDQPILYIPIVKAVFCFLSMSLVLFSYQIARSLASERAGRIAAFMTAFWYELVYFAHKPLTELMATYLFVGAVALSLTQNNRTQPYIFGILAGLSAVIRIQLIPAIAFLLLFYLWKWKLRVFLKSTISIFLVIIFFGFIDLLTWGTPFISFYNNILFNVYTPPHCQDQFLIKIR